MSLQLYPTFATAGNGQNYHQSPMLYYASRRPNQYDPSSSFLAMPSLVPEQQPIYYTLDAHGNYILLTPPQYNAAPLSPDQSDVSGEINTSLGAISRKSGGSGKARNSPAYKTMMCNMFSTSGSCSYGAGCQYAHGKEEIRPTVPHPKYKTQLCNKFNSPRGCQYGDKCHFRHPTDADLNISKSSESPKSPDAGK